MRPTKVNAGPTESNGRLLLGIWRDSLHVTCGLTACTPGSAPGTTLGNEYGKALPFLLLLLQACVRVVRHTRILIVQLFNGVGCGDLQQATQAVAHERR